MALRACKECGQEVSTKAERCPHCGASIRKQVSGCAGCLVVLVLGAIFLVVFAAVTGPGPGGRSAGASSSPAKSAEELRTERLKKQFSAWDGSHPALTRMIKKSMNDPDSYDHVETGYWDQGDHLIVKTTFRGKNAFGGVVVNWVKAKVNFDGRVLEIVEQGP